MKKLQTIHMVSIIFVALSLFMFSGFMVGYEIADHKALKSACNSEQTDILEFIIENENNVEIVSSHYDYKNGTGYLVLKNENIYTINVKVKKVAPFRYEWVEVDL